MGQGPGCGGRPTRARVRTGIALLLALPLVAVAAGTARAGEAAATITIIHGLPQFTADVYVNGQLVLDGFRPVTAAGPLRLAPGTYDLAIRSVGADPQSPPVLEARATLRAGGRYTAAAHLTATGGRTLTVFQDVLPSVPAGRSRLVARDLAAAPPFDLLFDGRVLFPGLRNPKQATSTLSPGKHAIEARSAAGADRLVRSTPLTMRAGTTHLLYVIGSASEGTLDFMYQDVEGRAAGPAGVQAGSGGLAAPPGFPSWALASIVLGLLGTAASAVAIRRRRGPWWRAPAWALGTSLLLLIAVPAGWAASRPPADAGVPPPAVAAPPGPRLAFDTTGLAGPAVPAVAVHSARLLDQASPAPGPIPVAIRIAAAAVDAPVVPVGVDSRSNDVRIPTDVETVGWYRFGSSPGEAGSSVLVGHVDSAEQGAGAFFRLGRLQPGARIVIGFAGGSTRSFRVVARRWYPKSRLPSRVFGRSGPAVLTLVTCGGAFDPATRHYAENVVIYAVPVGSPSAAPAGSGPADHMGARGRAAGA